MLIELIDELIERDPIWLSWRTQDTQNYIVNCWNWTHGTPIDSEAVHLFLCDERYGNLTDEQRSFAKERKAEIHEKHRIGQAITAMVGQCMGAGQIRRARQVMRSGLLLNLAVTGVVIVTVQLLAEPLVRLFDSTSPEVIRVGVLYLRLCCGVNSLVYVVMYTLDSFAIGVGAAHVAMVNALLDAVVVRLPVGGLLAFSLSMGFPGIYLGQALSPILPALVGFIYFKSRGWERKTLVRESLGESGRNE